MSRVFLARPDTEAVPRPIDTSPADALHTLRLAHDALLAGDTAADRPVTAQVLLATIVIRYPRRVEWEDVYRDAAPVIASYPARVIAIVRADAGAGPPGPVQAGLITSEGSGGTNVTRGQLLRIELGGHAYDEAASLAAAWSAGGVPLIVLWNGEAPVRDHLFEHLVGLSDHVLVDSSTTCDSARAFAALHRLLERRQSAVISDLLWSDLRPWRQAIAQIFDAPARLRELRALRACVFRPVPDSAGDAAALLAAGWIGARLAWSEPRRVDDMTWELLAGERTVRVSVETAPVPVAYGQSRLREVDLRSAGAAFSARRAGDDIVSSVRRGQAQERLGGLRAPVSSLPRRRLDALSDSAAGSGVFAAAVQLAAQLASA